MAMKTMNAFEQHVEKIVLAAAAAGAAFMGYLAIQKITIPDTTIGPNDVEQRISDSLDKMERMKADIAANHQPAVPSLNYVTEYQKLASGEPLDQRLVAVVVPMFGPKNISPTKVDTDTNIATYQVVTPEPVGPEDLKAEAWQQLVAVVPPPMATPGGGAPTPVEVPAGSVLPTRDQSATVVQGFIPIGKMRIELESQKQLNRIPNDSQRMAVLYRIQVQRRERTASGWTEYTGVKPTQAFPAPTDIPWKNVSDDLAAKMQLVDSEFQQIAIPDFYLDAAGQPIEPPIMSQPIPKGVDEENRKLQDELTRVGLPTGARPATPAVMPATPGTTQPEPLLPRSVDEIKNMQVIPFTFWDETVQPNHTYQYRVEVDFINPTYQWAFGLKNPAMKSKPILTTGWVQIQTPVWIQSDLAFFVTGVDAAREVETKVFKQNNGKWYVGRFTSRPGMNVAGKIQLVDQSGFPTIDVDTNYTIVDAQKTGDGGQVVLKDPSGNLITRDTATDTTDRNNILLMEKVEKPHAATTTAPEGGTVTPPVTPGRQPVTPGRPTPIAPTRPLPVPVSPTRPPAQPKYQNTAR